MTLVELLVVLFIISFVAGALLPLLQRVQRQPRKTYCASNMRQVLMALAMYEVDYGTVPCDGDGEVRNERDDVVVPGIEWAKVTLPYAGSREVFLCPSDETHGDRYRRGIPCSWSYLYNIVSARIYGGRGKRLSPLSPMTVCPSHLQDEVIVIGRLDTSVEVCNPHKYAPLHVVFE
jgi:hypothetical protein